MRLAKHFDSARQSPGESEVAVSVSERYYNDIEAEAERLRTTIRHLRGLVHRREIPCVRVGRLIRFDPVEVDRHLANCSESLRTEL